jgi:CheY-like chemotaxis protein
MSEITPVESSRKLKLLFVDNSRTMRAAMSSILTGQSYEVVTAATAQEAIEKVKTEPFDVAIFDLYMPFMNGYEAAKIIRALPDPCHDIPMIALTASNDPRDMDICKSAGMNDFIIKSEDHKDLFQTLEGYRKKLTNTPLAPITPTNTNSTNTSSIR